MVQEGTHALKSRKKSSFWVGVGARWIFSHKTTSSCQSIWACIGVWPTSTLRKSASSTMTRCTAVTPMFSRFHSDAKHYSYFFFFFFLLLC